MAKKSGYSNKGLFGNINHYDSKGHKIGESRPNFFGGYSNYDAKGHKIGESRPNFFGGYTSYDTHGNKVGSSSPSFLGGETHYDSQGHKVGSSSPSFLGSQNHTGEFSVSSDFINQAGAAAGVERDMNRILMATSTSIEEDSTRPSYPSASSSPIVSPPKDDFFSKNPSPAQSFAGSVRYYVVQSTNHESANYLAGNSLYKEGDWVYDSATGTLLKIRSVFVCQPKNLPAEVLNRKLVKASPPIDSTLSPEAWGKTPSPSNGDSANANDKNVFRTILAVLLIIIGCIVVIAIMNHSLSEKHWNDFYSMTDEFDAGFPGYLRQSFKSFPLANDLDIVVHSSVKKESYYDWYEWIESAEVTIYTDNTFDLYGEQAIYDSLFDAHDVFFQSWIAYCKTIPEHNKYSHAFPEKYKGLLITHDLKETVQIKTSNNTYQYSPYLRDYYVLNGKDHFLGQYGSIPSFAQSSKPAYSYSKPKSSGSGTDPYHASDYATPEDFYDDNYDEFFSYEDAESYYQDHEYD